jgi:hypothetical protein
LDSASTSGKAVGTPPLLPSPNYALLRAMEEVAEIQKGMEPVEGKDSLDYLREAREGALYGYTDDE